MTDSVRNAEPVLVALPTEIDAPNSRADRSWQLAIGLLASWRSTGGDRRALAARMAEVAAEGGETMVEQVALSLANVAGMFVELYADRVSASPDDVLRDVAALTDDQGLYG